MADTEDLFNFNKCQLLFGGRLVSFLGPWHKDQDEAPSCHVDLDSVEDLNQLQWVKH